MDAKTKRKHLNDYSKAARDIELAGVAITILERMNCRGAITAINALKRRSTSRIKKLDAAAAKLGAPYGA